MRNIKNKAIVHALATVLIATGLVTGASAQTETILHSFTGSGDGSTPQVGLILDSKGNLYGTTEFGGVGSSCDGCGTVFEFVPSSGGTWSENVLYAFGGTTGAGTAPRSGLVFDSKGNLYGTTTSGGQLYSGTVFQLSPNSNGTWTETTLYSFTGGTDGGYPYSGVVLNSAGNIYGVTLGGGADFSGVVYELVAGANGTWTERILHTFTGGNDGGAPLGTNLIFDGAGNLYGIASEGGAHDYGVVFKLTKAQNGSWTEKVLYSFPGGSGGSAPTGNLIFDSAGNLYGTATFIAYELSPNSDGTWSEKTLHAFAGGSDGAYAYGGLVFDKSGNLYGTSNTGGLHRGTVFELTPNSNGTWTEKILHKFSPTGGDGSFPDYGSLVVDASGNVYGTTPGGGASGDGTVFKIAP